MDRNLASLIESIDGKDCLTFGFQVSNAMPDIYLYLDGQQSGPYQPDQLRQMLAEGRITLETLAWHQGLSEWRTLSKIPEVFPMAGAVPGMPPPPPARPTPAKKGMNGCLIAALIACGVGIFVLPCLAGIALGPITVGIEKAKENASMQQARGIALVMFMYANDHNGNYPDGATSTEVFQKLIDEKYVSDPSLFYFAMAGKTKPVSGHLTADNVCFDVTSGISSDSSDFVPVVFSVGYNVSYNAGDSALRDPTIKSPYSGMAVAYKNNSARFLKALPDGIVPHLINNEFNAGAHNYRQLKP